MHNMNPAALAPEIDRLVWAVNFRARDHEVDLAILEKAGMDPSAFGTLNNLVPFVDVLTDEFVLRRYLYRPPQVLKSFIADMVDGGFFSRDGDHLRPTDRVQPILEELNTAVRNSARYFWVDYRDSVEAAAGPVRRILEASPERFDLAQAAISGPKPDDLFHRFHYRLSGLRLLRNEAHVEAWRRYDLTPGEIELLTAAWGGDETQTPVVMTDRLEERGLVAGGAVTAAGLKLRQTIEDETNVGVVSAFATVDQDSLYSVLVSLPPETP
jgi:hypothetical protein